MPSSTNREDILKALVGVSYDEVTKESLPARSNEYRHPFVDECKPGDLVWSLPRGIRGQEGLVVIRFREGRSVRGFLSRAGEDDHEGPVVVENGLLFLRAERPAGDVFNLLTGRRVT
jgi:hypothetical protein